MLASSTHQSIFKTSLLFQIVTQLEAQVCVGGGPGYTYRREDTAMTRGSLPVPVAHLEYGMS